MDSRDLIERFITSLEARDWDAWTLTVHPEVVYVVPQTRECARGRDSYLRFNREFPGDWHLRPKLVVADDDHGVIWYAARYADGDEDEAIAFFDFRDGLIASVTDFWPEAYEPPPGREHLVERW